MNTKTNTTFKKSVLSFLVVTAVAGAFIPWEDYLPRSETPAMTAFYENSDALQEQVVSQSIMSLDSDRLAEIAEENLISVLDAEIDEQVLMSAQAFTEQAYSPEADEAIDNAIDEFVLDKTEEKQAPAGEFDDAKVTSQGPVMIESPLLFAFDSSEIKPDYYEALNETAMFMQSATAKTNSVWQIVGYADLSGNRIYNGKLAKKRAQKVAAYLVDKGVEEDQLSVVSLGASNPINQERSIANNRHERRVEIHAYQAEITALVDQYNKQLQQQIEHVAKLKEQQKNTQQTAQEVTQPENVIQQQTAKAILEGEKNSEPKVVESSETKKEVPLKSAEELTERLTTAMEL